MTVIAWDGKTLSADRLVTCGDTLRSATKIQKVIDGAVAWTGDLDSALMLRNWYLNGAIPKEFPETQKDNDRWARLVVATRDTVFFYERGYVSQIVEDDIAAWGVGREAALGAMAMGANAKQAVEIASRFVAGCGRGADAVEVRHG